MGLLLQPMSEQLTSVKVSRATRSRHCVRCISRCPDQAVASPGGDRAGGVPPFPPDDCFGFRSLGDVVRVRFLTTAHLQSSGGVWWPLGKQGELRSIFIV